MEGKWGEGLISSGIRTMGSQLLLGGRKQKNVICHEGLKRKKTRLVRLDLFADEIHIGLCNYVLLCHAEVDYAIPLDSL